MRLNRYVGLFVLSITIASCANRTVANTPSEEATSLTAVPVGERAVATVAEATLREKLSSYVHVGAHRGGNLSGRGNTMAQFRQALADGADIIETDLRLTKDGVAVIFHDKDLSRATSCRGSVARLTYAELQNCRFKTNTDTIPQFEELLALSRGRFIINAEFKRPEVIEAAIALMHKYGGENWVYFQTQDKRSNYVRARAADKHVNLIYYAKTKKDVAWALSQKEASGAVDANLLMIELNPAIQILDVVQAIHQGGKLTSACSFQVVKDKEKSKAACDVLLKRGIDILITDQTAGCVRQRNEFH